MKRAFPFLAVFLLFSSAGAADDEVEAKHRAASVKNLKILHKALNGYLEKNGHWPQMPADLQSSVDKAFFDWWKETLRPYGMKEENWFRSDDITAKMEGTGSYSPTLFNASQSTPFRWEKPWAVERENFGGGELVLYPDGRVMTAAAWAEQKKQREKPQPPVDQD